MITSLYAQHHYQNREARGVTLDRLQMFPKEVQLTFTEAGKHAISVAINNVDHKMNVSC